MDEEQTFEASLLEAYATSQAIMTGVDAKLRNEESKTYDALTKDVIALSSENAKQIEDQRNYELKKLEADREYELKKAESEQRRELELKKHKHEIAQNWTKVGIGVGAVGFEAFLAYATLKFNLNLGNMVGDKKQGSVLRKLGQLGSIFK